MDSGLSIFQTNIFINNFKLTLGPEYESKCTMIHLEPDCFKINKIDKAKTDQNNVISQVNYWVAVKGCFLKHYSEVIRSEDGTAVDSYEYFMQLQNHEVPKLKDELEAFQTNFENIFCLARSLHDMTTYIQLKNNIKNIKETQEKLDRCLRDYQKIIESDPLMNTYSRYLSCLYRAMTTLCKLVDEPVYTWKMFLRIIDSVIVKKKREQKKREKEEAEEGESGDGSDRHIEEYKEKLGLTEKKPEMSFDFLYSEIIPSIYSVICASYSTENVSLLNLIFALEIGNQRGSFEREEMEFFLEAIIKFDNYKDWRKPDTAFCRITSKIVKSEYMRLKRNLIKLYPQNRDLFDKIDDKVETYKDIMNILFKDDREKQTLMEDINLRFLCPDDEFRSKICQLVYEELLAIFDFNEDPVKLHSFIKTASWPYPVAVKASESINIVNTICSIASFYGVGLEVIRNDVVNPVLTDQNYRANQTIKANLNEDQKEDPKAKLLSKKHEEDENFQKPVLLETKPPQSFSMKYKTNEYEDEEETKLKGIDSTLEIIERCALNGTWVLISTPEFPSFWRRMCARIEGIQVVNSFRIFIDLQSIDYFTVPPSFLCDYSVRFILTESNNEDMEGFNDVWANILNGDIINNSENISEHPSLAVNNKQFIEKKVDISATHQMMGDISVINNQEGDKKIANVIVPNDISKEEGEIFQEITSALDTEQKALVKEAKENPTKDAKDNAINEEVNQSDSLISEEEPNPEPAEKSPENLEMKSVDKPPAEDVEGSSSKVENLAILQDKPDPPLKEENSKEIL